MTQCEKGKLAPAKDADHKKPIQHYVMQPGTAWHLTNSGREEVKITPEQAKRAVPTLCLLWHSHGTAAEFRIGDDLYAQPTAALPAPTKRGRSPEAKAERTSPLTDHPVVGATETSGRAERRRKAAKPRKEIVLAW